MKTLAQYANNLEGVWDPPLNNVASFFTIHVWNSFALPLVRDWPRTRFIDMMI